MCSLFDIRYLERWGDTIYVYATDSQGVPTSLVRTRHQYEPRNLEQWVGDWIDAAIIAVTWHPFVCGGCGTSFRDFDGVLKHLELYRCRGCQEPTPKWEGWNYHCPSCDRQAHPDYHRRNPG